MSDSRNWEENKRQQRESSEQPHRLSIRQMYKSDLWEQFVQENWAPILESAYGPDWKNGHPEDVSAILWLAMSQMKNRDTECATTGSCTSEGQTMPSSLAAQQNSALTFGSFQPDSVDDDMSDNEEDHPSPRGRSRREQVREQRSKSASMPEQLLSVHSGMGMHRAHDVPTEDDLCRSWNGSLSAADLNALLEKLDLDSFPGIDWEDFPKPSEELMRAWTQERMSGKHPPQTGSRQERRKFKRPGGGTKRQGEEMSVTNPSMTEKPQVSQVEHRIEITGTTSTFGAHSRSVPSKQVSGITNEPTFRIPVDHGNAAGPSPAGMFHGYSFSASANDDAGAFKSCSSSSISQSAANYPYPSNPSSIFSLFGGGMASLEGAPMNDWVMESEAMAMDMDDPHHPHKKVHKQFSADTPVAAPAPALKTTGKAVKKQGRRHGARQVTPGFSSKVSSSQIPGMTSPVAPFSGRGNLDDAMDSSRRDSRNQLKPSDGLGESKSKKEEAPCQGSNRNTNPSGKERTRATTQNQSQRQQQYSSTSAAATKESASGSRGYSGGRQPSSGRGGDSLSSSHVTGDKSATSKPQSRNIIDRVDVHGRCPLHVAVMAGRADVVDVLLQHGCDAMKVLPIDLLNQGPGGQPLTESSLCSPSLGRSSKSEEEAVERMGDETAEEQRDAQESEKGSQYGDSTDENSEEGSVTGTDYGRVMAERRSFVDRLSFKYCNALHLAAYFGHITVLNSLLENSTIDPEAKNEHGCTPLHLAANKGHKHIVTRLLEVPGCSVDTTDARGLSALHHAAAKGRSSIIDILWPKGCKIDAADVKGWTALHYAAHAGHVDAVGNLIIAGCPVSKFDTYGLTPGHLAAYRGHVTVLEKLLHAGFYHDLQGGLGASQGPGGCTALHMAATKGHVPVIKQLLAEGANIHKEDHRGLNPLQCAAEGGHLESFNVLLEAGCNPKTSDTAGTTLLHSAATGGNWDIVSKLLDLDCDPSVRTNLGKTLLHHAAQVGALKVTENLLRLGCDINVPDKDENMPWHAAAEGGNLDVLKIFLGRNCDIEAKNNIGMTALHCGAFSGSVDIVQALIDKGANLRAVNVAGQTALHIAAERSHQDVLIMLAERVDAHIINLKDIKGNTILHHVCEGKAPKALALLVKRGADVNALSESDQTPLHLATITHSESIVKELLEYRCNPAAKDCEGCTALHYAAQRNDASIFEILFRAEGCNIADKDKRGYGLLHYAVEGGNPNIVGKLLLSGAAKYDQMEGSGNVMNALHVACELGHDSVAAHLIKDGYRVQGRGPSGMEPIHYASGATRHIASLFTSDTPKKADIRRWTHEESEKHNAIVDMLLEKEAEVHVVDECGCNVLMYAAGVGDFELVMKFLKMGVDPKQCDLFDHSCMHWAANSGNDKIIKELLDHGVPVDSCDRSGRLPLHRAAQAGELMAVRAFVSAMTEKHSDIHKKDAKGFTPVQLAATAGYVDVVTELLENPKGKDIKGSTGLHLAVRMKMRDIVRALLKSGNCDVNARDAEGCTPLHYAAEFDQCELVEWLVEAKADMFISNSEGMMPLHRAAAEGHCNIVEKLIEHGALRNYCTPSGSTPLHYAATSGRLGVMKILIDKGIPVNQMSNGSVACTALYNAANNGCLEAVNLLLEFKAEVDTVCANECTALHVAASNGHTAVVKRLISAGAEVDFQTNNSIAAIHNAVNNGHIETVGALISADCDVDIQNSGGNTPLHVAASKGNLEIARLLLATNCDLHIKNVKGHQAIHSAASNGFFEVVLLLVQHGAPWRQKGDLDVAKMLCRKSTFMASYIDGRLRIAERAKHRKAKPAESLESIPTEEELRRKQAEADAVMAELLAEEEKEKKQGDQRQKSKRNKDRRKKSQSISESKKEASQKNKESPNPSEKIDEIDYSAEHDETEDTEKSEKEERTPETLPRVIMRGSVRKQLESPSLLSDNKAKTLTATLESRPRKRESQSRQKKNRQPAPRPVEPVQQQSAKSHSDAEGTSTRKTSSQLEKKCEEVAATGSQSANKGRGGSVTVIRRRTQGQPGALKNLPGEAKKSTTVAASPHNVSGREVTSKESVTQSTKASSKKSTTGLTTAPCDLETRTSEKSTARQSSARALSMAAVVAGQKPSAKNVASVSPEVEHGVTDSIGPSPIKKQTESSHVWADAVKSTMEKKTPEAKIEVLKSTASGRKKLVKTQKPDSDVIVVNVSSNRKAFLPFAESATVTDKPSSGWSSKPPSLMSAPGSDVPVETMPSDHASETVTEGKDDLDAPDDKPSRDPPLKWVTKELSSASGQNTDLKGMRVAPMTHKLKKLNLGPGKEETSTISPVTSVEKEESEEKAVKSNPWKITPPLHSPVQISTALPVSSGAVEPVSRESPWKSIRSENLRSASADTSGYPPLPLDRSGSLQSVGGTNAAVPVPTGFPFPGGSSEWRTESCDMSVYSPTPPPPPPPPKIPLQSSQSWHYSSGLPLTSVEMGGVLHSSNEAFDDGGVSFGDPSSFMYPQMEQMDPDSLLPPELKDEITNGGATSIHFRTKSSISSSRGSPTSTQSPSSKLLSFSSLPPNSPAWTKNPRGPYFHGRTIPPPPPAAPPVMSQNDTILSRIPDDPWEIDEVDVSAVPKIPEIAQPPPPDVHAYEEWMPHMCPLSSRPFTDPVVAADGITYDRASIQEWMQVHDRSHITGHALESETEDHLTVTSILSDYVSDSKHSLG